MKQSLEHFGRVAFVLGLVALAACGDPVGPLAPGVYVLKALGGDPLPATRYLDPDGTHAVLLADTITLFTDGKADRVFVLRVTNSPHRPDTVYGSRHATNYRITGDKIEVGIFFCPPNAICTGPDTGRVVGSGFTLRGMRDEKWVLGEYFRVSGP